MNDSKKLYNRIRVGREVFMIEEPYEACPRLTRSVVKKKKMRYYGEITITTSKDEYYLRNPTTKVFTSKKAANEVYAKRLKKYSKTLVKERKALASNLDKNQRKIDEVKWRLHKATE